MIVQAVSLAVSTSRERSFYSYLTYSTKWESLSASERDKIKNLAPYLSHAGTRAGN